MHCIYTSHDRDRANMLRIRTTNDALFLCVAAPSVANFTRWVWHGTCITSIMQGQATHNKVSMVVCEDRCSEGIRELAKNHGWILVEGIGTIAAMHTCVAVEPTSVCIEMVRTSKSVPDLLRMLAECDSIDQLSCFRPKAPDRIVHDLSMLGVRVLTDPREVSEWFCHTDTHETTPKADSIGNRARIRVHRRVPESEWSHASCK